MYMRLFVIALLIHTLHSTDTSGQIPVTAYEPVAAFFDAKTKFRDTLEKCPVEIDFGKLKIRMDKNGLSATKRNPSDQLADISLAQVINADVAALDSAEKRREYCNSKLGVAKIRVYFLAFLKSLLHVR